MRSKNVAENHGTCASTSASVDASLLVSTPTPISVSVLIYYVHICNMALTSDTYSVASSLNSWTTFGPWWAGSSFSLVMAASLSCMKSVLRSLYLFHSWWHGGLGSWSQGCERGRHGDGSSASPFHALLVLDHIPVAGGPAPCTYGAHANHSRCVGHCSHFFAQPFLLYTHAHTHTHTHTQRNYSTSIDLGLHECLSSGCYNQIPQIRQV